MKMPTDDKTNEQVVQTSRVSRKSSFLFILIQEQKDGHVEGDEAEITNGGVMFKVLLEL